MLTAYVREMRLTVARFAFLMLLIASVALYGGTQAATQYWLEWALIGVAVVYATGRAISARKSRLDRRLPIAALILLAIGWLAACFPASVFDHSLGVFLPISSGSWWPWGTVDPEMSIPAMKRITGMLGALLMANDMGRHPGWRRSALALMAWLGVGEAVFGLMHHLSGDIWNYWGTVGTRLWRDTVFGVFFYHGNAGAFLNLCWPLLAAQTWREFNLRSSDAPFQQSRRAIHVLGLLAMLSAIWVNHSRAAQVVFLLQNLVAAGFLVFSIPGGIMMLQTRLRTILITAGVSILCMSVIVGSFGMDKSLEKWTKFSEGGLAADGRWAVVQTCRPWLDEIPMLGFGPGTFAAVYYVKTADVPGRTPGYWQFAHNDYLQTLIEWGWLGVALWLAFGGFILATLIIATARAGQDENAPRQAALLAVVIALVSVVLHAVVDFPLQIFAIQLYVAVLAGVGRAMVMQTNEEAGLNGMAQVRRQAHRSIGH